jgi:hypothetical protein
MSVYYEAILTGRIHPADCPSRQSRAGHTVYTVTKRALRERKRLEAVLRNEYTPHDRTRRYRRELAADLAAARRERVRRG